MVHPQLSSILILFLLGFIAALIDSTVGGGGLITLPTLLSLGLPPTLAFGTNKFAGTLCALTSSTSYFRSGKINVKVVAVLLPLSLLGAIVGAIIVHHLSTSFLKPLVIVLLFAVLLYTIWKKDIGRHMTFSSLTKKTWLIAAFVALIIGFYDGFFGPGTGSFLILFFLFIGFDFISAAGNAKVLNLASNIAALAAFAVLHSIDFFYGIILGGAMILGALIGPQIAMRKGVTFIRPIFILITFVLLLQQVWNLF